MIIRSLILLPYVMTDSQIWYYLNLFLEYVAVLSAGLAVFNLFPIPPLDGSKVLFSFLPSAVYNKLMYYERYGMLLLTVLLVTGVLDTPLRFLRSALLDAAVFVSTPIFSFLASHFI